MLILLKTCEFCIFWTVYRFHGGGAQKNAAAGRFTAAFCGLFFPGSGRIEVVQIDGMPVSLTGEYFTLIVIHKDAPGAIAEVTRILTHYSGNICHFDLSRKARGGEAIMTLSMDALEHSDIPALCAEIEAHDIIYKCIAVQPIA